MRLSEKFFFLRNRRKFSIPPAKGDRGGEGVGRLVARNNLKIRLCKVYFTRGFRYAHCSWKVSNVRVVWEAYLVERFPLLGND